jgi:hypothetical protein
MRSMLTAQRARSQRVSRQIGGGFATPSRRTTVSLPATKSTRSAFASWRADGLTVSSKSSWPGRARHSVARSHA